MPNASSAQARSSLLLPRLGRPAQTSCCPGRNSFWICRLGGIGNCRRNDVMPCCLSTRRKHPKLTASAQRLLSCLQLQRNFKVQRRGIYPVHWYLVLWANMAKSSESPHFPSLAVSSFTVAKETGLPRQGACRATDSARQRGYDISLTVPATWLRVSLHRSAICYEAFQKASD
jgi:hypothetical protein